jgi:hypothetical protein
MNKRFAILSTWNGDGYSTENILEGIFNLENDASAKAKCFELMNEHQTLDEAMVSERDNGFIWEFEEDGDSGSYQAFEITEDLYGFVVLTNINDVIPCTNEEFEELKADAIEQADEDDLDEDELEENEFFIGAYEGEYDYQFIKL